MNELINYYVNQQMQLIQCNWWQVLICYMFRHPGCHPQGVFHMKGIQAQKASPAMQSPHSN